MKSHFPTRSLLGATALVGLGFAFCGAPAQAQQTELDTLREQIAALQNRLNTLEDAQKKTADTAKAAPASVNAGKFPLVVSGLIQVHSLNYLNENVKTGGAGSNDTFRLRRSEIRITAPSITNRLSGTINIDVARAASTTTPGTFQGGANNILQDLQVTYKASPVTNTTSQLFFDAGQFKVPIGYEAALVPTSQVPLLERSLIFTGRDPFGTTYGDQRDVGVQARAVTKQFEARAGIFNGFGDRQNALAATDEKALIALLAYKPTFVNGLTVGASGGAGNTGVSFTPTGGTATNLKASRNIFNAFAVYKKNKITLQGEYLRGHSAPFTVATVTNGSRNLQGFYAGGSYLFNPRFETLLRYDTLNFNTAQTGNIVRDYILGFNYYIKGQNKLQLNIVRRVGGLNAPTSTNPAANYRNNRFELRTGVQLAF